MVWCAVCGLHFGFPFSFHQKKGICLLLKREVNYSMKYLSSSYSTFVSVHLVSILDFEVCVVYVGCMLIKDDVEIMLIHFRLYGL